MVKRLKMNKLRFRNMKRVSLKMGTPLHRKTKKFKDNGLLKRGQGNTGIRQLLPGKDGPTLRLMATKTNKVLKTLKHMPWDTF